MKNRFGNRETLNLQIGGGGFDPNVGATGGIKPSANVSSAGPAGSEAASRISAIMGEFSTGEAFSKSGNILGSLRSLGIVQS
jgi:hypothetical protein